MIEVNEGDLKRGNQGRNLSSPIFWSLVIGGIITVGGIGFSLIDTHVKSRELSRKNRFNSYSQLVPRTVQEGEFCMDYARELKEKHHRFFGDWNTKYLANKIQEISGNPDCKALVPGKTIIYLPEYSQHQ